MANEDGNNIAVFGTNECVRTRFSDFFKFVEILNTVCSLLPSLNVEFNAEAFKNLKSCISIKKCILQPFN